MMKQGSRIVTTVALLPLIVVSSFVGSLAAQPSTPEPVRRSVAIYPKETGPDTFITIQIEPGQTGEFVLVVGNAGNIAQGVRTYPTPVITAANGGFSLAPYGTELGDPDTWLNLNEEIFELEPGTGIEMTVQVTVPEGTDPGEYVTAVAADQAEAFTIDGGSQVTQRVRRSVPVLIVVPGELNPAFELDAAELTIREDTIIGSISITNTGNAIIRPEGEVRLISDEGEVLGVAQVALGSVYVNQGTTFIVSWQNVRAADTYSLQAYLAIPETAVAVTQTFDDLEPTVELAPGATPVAVLEFTIAELTPLTRDQPPSGLLFEGELSNPGAPIENARVSIVTYLDGEEIDRYPIMQAVTLGSGSTPIEARYTLPGGFTEGTYTFAVTIEVGDGSSQSIMLTQEIDFEVVMPD